jgi:hypothetical protein
MPETCACAFRFCMGHRGYLLSIAVSGTFGASGQIIIVTITIIRFFRLRIPFSLFLSLGTSSSDDRAGYCWAGHSGGKTGHSWRSLDVFSLSHTNNSLIISIPLSLVRTYSTHAHTQNKRNGRSQRNRLRLTVPPLGWAGRDGGLTCSHTHTPTIMFSFSVGPEK